MPSKEPIEELNEVLAEIRSRKPSEVDDEILQRAIELSNYVTFSKRNAHLFQRTILLPQILQRRRGWLSAEDSLRELCEDFLSIPFADETPALERCVVKALLARAEILACIRKELSSEEYKSHYVRAKTLLREARKLYAVHDLTQLGDLIEQHESFLRGVDQSDYQLVLRFDLPFALPMPDGTYEVRTQQGHRFEIDLLYKRDEEERFTARAGEDGIEITAKIEVRDHLEPPEDREPPTRVDSIHESRSGVGFTAVVLRVPSIISAEQFDIDLKKRPSAEEPETVPHPLDIYTYPPECHVAARLINVVIDQLRQSSGRYQIERISAADIQVFAMATQVGGENIREHPMRMPGTYRVQRGEKKPDWFEALVTSLRRPGGVNFVERLIMDAKQNVLHGDLRLAIVNLNAALEYFMNTHIWERLESAIEHEEIRAFMEGESIFETCRNQICQRASRDKAIYAAAADLHPTPNVNPAQKRHPSVFKMGRFLNNQSPLGISNTKLSERLNRIRHNRNEVIHGELEDGDLDPKRVYESIEELEDLMALAEQTA